MSVLCIRFCVKIGGEDIVTVGRRSLSVLLGILLGVSAMGCGRRDDPASTCALADACLESHQGELLDIAFGAASAIPIDPHSKSRSQAQTAVVEACLTLNQPQRAISCAEQIRDWRRGMAYADLACHCIRRGLKIDVEPYLDRAARIAEEAEDWRKDRIRDKIAAARTMGRGEDDFDAEMAASAKVVSSGQFDAVKGVLGRYARLFDRVYADAGRRRAVEERIRASWNGMPGFIRLDLLMELAQSAIVQSDRVKAMELIQEAWTIVDSARWQPTIEIPVRAKLAELRFRAGDPTKANEEAKAALDLFDAKREQIANIYRAQTLRPIAEAYQEMGQADAACGLYRLAVEAGVENPNSRPRAEDLAATCCSMAVHAVKPDPQLLGRIREIRGGLGDPW